jgi:hypothetical protein
MTPKADDLVKHLAALTQRFAALATKLAQAAQDLRGSGTLPAESLIEELAAARDEFVALRSSVLDAARALAIAAPPHAEVGSLKALEPVITAMAETVANEAKRTTAAEARRRVLTVLDRVMTINHVDDPNFAALLDCQAKAREIRAAVLDPTGPTAESAAAIMECTPAFSALLTLVEGRDQLDDEKFAVLEESVVKLFGRTLAVAVTRGKLVTGAGVAPRAPERPAPPPRVLEEPVRPVVTAPPEPAAPPAPPPLRSAEPHPVALTASRSVAPAAPPPAPPIAPPPVPPAAPPPAPAPVRQEAATAPPVQDEGTADAVESAATLDEGAQWWVSAWARWTSWKGTIDFKAGVKQELSKYAYLLSVPIQKSTDYEDGLLAYGYSILLDFLEAQTPGIVTKALNSLKTFVPGKAGHAPSVGAHLYTFLLGEARLAERYPDFVRSVLVAAVPEPGLWTQVRILESSTETSVFTHPSTRVGDPAHNSQRLTQDRQRFADHRFPVALPPLTAQFFAVAADLKEPRGIDVKLTQGRADSNDAWLLTVPPVGRADLKSELVRLEPEGSSVPGLGKDYATLWVAVFNADPKAEKKYELTLTLNKDASRSGAPHRSARA